MASPFRRGEGDVASDDNADSGGSEPGNEPDDSQSDGASADEDDGDDDDAPSDRDAAVPDAAFRQWMDNLNYNDFGFGRCSLVEGVSDGGVAPLRVHLYTLQ